MTAATRASTLRPLLFWALWIVTMLLLTGSAWLGWRGGTEPLNPTAVALLAVAAVVVLVLAGVPTPDPARIWASACIPLAITVPALGQVLNGGTAQWAALTIALVAAALLLGSRFVPPTDLRVAVLVVLTGWMALSLLLGIGAAFGVTESAYYDQDRDWTGLPQLRGFSGHPNTLSMLAVLALGLGSSAILRNRHTMSRAALAAAVLLGPVLSAMVLLWTQSRTGWIAGAAVLLIVLIPARGRALTILGGVVVGAAAVTAVAPPVIAAATGASFTGRWYAWDKAVDVLLADPTGLGAAFFDPAFWTRYPAAPWQPAHAHNEFLQAGGTSGWLGVALTLVSAAAVSVVAVGALPNDGRWGLVVVATLAVNAGVETVSGFPQVPVTYLPVLVSVTVLAASLGAWRGSREQSVLVI